MNTAVRVAVRVALDLGHTVLGVENGFPIGTDIANVEDFYNRGMRYMTLSHSGDNQICASSGGPPDREDFGLTEYGIELRPSDEVCKFLVDTTCGDRSYGARPLRRAIQRHIEDALSEALIQGRFPEKGGIVVYLAGDRLEFRSVLEPSSA